MSEQNLPNPLLQLLLQQLQTTEAINHQVNERNARLPILQVPGTGKAITSAYEQLRIAAE